jgi:hypothetical protein
MKLLPDEHWELIEDKERKVDRFIMYGMAFAAIVIAGLLFYIW